MAISNYVIEQSYEDVGLAAVTYQRESSAYQELWMRLIVGNVVETDTTYKFTMNTVFKQYAYANTIFWEQGCWVIDTSGTIKDGTHYTRGNLTTSSGGSQMTAGSGSQGLWLGEQTFTVTKPDYQAAIIPYAKIGGITEGTTNYAQGNFWYWGNTYGCLQFHSFGTDKDWYGLTATMNDITLDINAATITGTSNHDCNLVYDNAVIKVSTPPLSGSRIQAGSTREPRQSMSMTHRGRLERLSQSQFTTQAENHTLRQTCRERGDDVESSALLCA